MANLSEDIQCAGSDTRPPMLDKTDFASWQQRIRLYCRGSLHLGPERSLEFSSYLSRGCERIGTMQTFGQQTSYSSLPKDIYSLIKSYTLCKDIWDNVKMHWKESELTKEDVNPTGGGLKDSNFDQLYAYLKQHEAHANENKMMLERLTQQTVDPLALMSNVSPQHYHSQSSTNPPTTYHQPHSADTSQSDLGDLPPTDNLIENLTNTLALLTQSYKTYLPQTNNQLRTSSNTRNQAIVQDGRVVVQNV
ncbi:hypothetical protein Tco_0377474 [Tanacetum coccineum]